MEDRRELRRRLSRLGRPRRHEEPRDDQGPRALQEDLGMEVATASGPAYRLENRFPSEHPHGSGRLADLLDFDAGLAAEIARQPALGEVPLERLAFLDTETTGLAGGAGTLVFLVGIGTFSEGVFRLHQYFLRNPAQEAGMLEALQEDLEAISGFVSFNGQAFDVPLLEMRYQIGLRRRWSLGALPHLDLLHPSRRLWRRALPTAAWARSNARCWASRGPGRISPAHSSPLYLDYLRTGDTRGMSRVIYHNSVDILSLVGLAAQVLQRHRQTELARLSGSEALAVARWHELAGRWQPADEAFRVALEAVTDPLARVEALRRYTSHLKRQERWGEAIPGWQAWHGLEATDPEPCLELAKYYEWQRKDLAEAWRWAEAGLVCLSHWPPGWRRDEALGLDSTSAGEAGAEEGRRRVGHAHGLPSSRQDHSRRTGAAAFRRRTAGAPRHRSPGGRSGRDARPSARSACSRGRPGGRPAACARPWSKAACSMLMTTERMCASRSRSATRWASSCGGRLPIETLPAPSVSRIISGITSGWAIFSCWKVS